MNSRLKYPEVIDAYQRMLRMAEYKVINTKGTTKKKWEGLACLYEATIHYLTNRITNKSEHNGQSVN